MPFNATVLRPSLVALVLSTGAVRAQVPSAELGFESVTNGRPTGWSAGGAMYDVQLDSVAPFAGRYSLRTTWIGTAPFTTTSGQFAVASRVIPPGPFVGRHLHLSGYIRTEKVDAGYAGLWMRVDGPQGVTLAFDNMSTRGAHGTTPWTRYDIDLPVDPGAILVTFGVLHPGNGRAWFDSLSLTPVGEAPTAGRDRSPARPRGRSPAGAHPRLPEFGRTQRWLRLHQRQSDAARDAVRFRALHGAAPRLGLGRRSSEQLRAQCRHAPSIPRRLAPFLYTGQQQLSRPRPRGTHHARHGRSRHADAVWRRALPDCRLLGRDRPRLRRADLPAGALSDQHGAQGRPARCRDPVRGLTGGHPLGSSPPDRPIRSRGSMPEST